MGAGRAQSTFRRKGVRFRSRAEAKAEARFPGSEGQVQGAIGDDEALKVTQAWLGGQGSSEDSTGSVEVMGWGLGGV